MNYFTNKRLLILTIAVLILLNLGTLLTIWFIRMAPRQIAGQPIPEILGIPPEPPPPIGISEAPPPPPPPPIGLQAVMTSELGLSAEQRRFFQAESERFMKRSEEILRHYHRDKRRMLLELTEKSPDTVLIGHLTITLGDQQTELERLMVRYFLNLKGVCTPAQQEKIPQIVDHMLIKLSLENKVNKTESHKSNKK